MENMGNYKFENETDLPVLDQNVLNDLRQSSGRSDGLDGLLKRVLLMFEAQAPMSFEHLRLVSARDDMAALADAVHGLKSMCANIGAAKVADACNRMEVAARSGGEIDIGAGLAEISNRLNEALGQIKRLQTG